VLQFTPDAGVLATMGAASLSVRKTSSGAPHFVVVPENAAQAYLRNAGKDARTIADAADGADPINPCEAPEDSPEMPADAPTPAAPHVALDRTTAETTKDRALLKAYLLQEGKVDSGCRFGLERLRSVALETLATPAPEQAPAAPPPEQAPASDPYEATYEAALAALTHGGVTPETIARVIASALRSVS